MEDAREAALVEEIGEPDREFAFQPFLNAILRLTARSFAESVEPLVERHWPELRSTPLHEKLRTVAIGFFACAPYTALLVSCRRPPALRLFVRAGRRLRQGPKAIARGLALVLPLYARLRLRVENRRIILGATFIALADDVLDHELAPLAPGARIAALRAALDRSEEPASPALALLSALWAALERTAPGGAAELEPLRHGCLAWAEAEMARQQGIPDPDGLAHRGAGIAAGAAGMAWTVARFAGPSEQAFVAEVGRLMQIIDDCFDLEADLAAGVRTPAAEGIWNAAAAGAQLARTRSLLVELAARGGEPYPPYSEVIEGVYVQQIRSLFALMRQRVIA